MSKYPLLESGRAVADAAGVATVSLGPRRAFESWHIVGITVQSTSIVLVPEARVYAGAVAAARLIDGTYTGTLDHSDADRSLRATEDIVCQWTGCDVGAVCTLTVEGEALR